MFICSNINSSAYFSLKLIKDLHLWHYIFNIYMDVNFMVKYFNMNYKISIVPKGVVGLIAVQL